MENEPLEQLPVTKPGNKVLRRLRKRRNKFSTTCQGIAKRIRGISGRHQG